MAPKTDKTEELSLPVVVATPVDIGRLIRELEQLDNSLLQASLRDKDHVASIPKMSQMMDRLVQLNQLDLHDEAVRQSLQKFLVTAKEKSPVLHMSFSADPSPAFIEKLMTWLRREIHPAVLLTIGLQPNIGAGCIMRSTNKQFDFSMKQAFIKKRNLLSEALAAVASTPAAATVAAPASNPAAVAPPAEVPA